MDPKLHHFTVYCYKGLKGNQLLVAVAQGGITVNRSNAAASVTVFNP